MKKFLSVLLLVLCLALPAAAAETWTATTADGLQYAVTTMANSGDTIVVAESIDLGESALAIPFDKTLTLQISKDCVLSASNDSGSSTVIENSGNLTITGSGRITSTCTGESGSARGVEGQSGSTTIINGSVEITATSPSYAYGVCADSGSNVIIEDSVEITATGGLSTTEGVHASDSTVTIADSVKIIATGGSEKSYGVTATGDEPTACVVKILNGTVSGDLFVYDGTITVYEGKFSKKVDKAYLAPDSVCSDEPIEGFYVVTKKDSTPSSDVSNGGCNAGFAGLALAAFALLAAKRKK